MDYAIFLSSVTLFALSMCFTPGPNNALAMATGLDKGFWAALPHCLAVPVGGLTSLAALYLGLGQVFTRFPVVYEVLRYTGAVYMVWLAWRISGLGQRKTAQAQSSAKSAGAAASGPQGGITPLTFGQSFLLQFVNVKAWITNVVIISNYVIWILGFGSLLGYFQVPLMVARVTAACIEGLYIYLMLRLWVFPRARS